MSVCTATGFVLLFGTGIVVPELQCPNAPDTVTTSSPDEIKAEAAKCLNHMKTHSKNGLAAFYRNIILMSSVIFVN